MTVETQTAPVAATDNSPLTIDQAVDLQLAAKEAAAEPAPPPKKAKLKAPPVEVVEQEDAPATEDEAVEESEADTQSDEDVEGEPEEANAEDDEADPAEPELPAIAPPQFWDAEGKESFAKLSPESQRQVLKYEEQRTKAVAKAMQESAEVRKQADAKLKQLQSVAERIGEYEEGARVELTEMQGDLVAWDKWFASQAALELFDVNPAQYRLHEAEHNQLKALYQEKGRAYQKAQTDKSTAEKAALKEFWDEQARLMPELVPELVDEKEGPARKKELFSYLHAKGFEPERIQGISAQEAQLAWKSKKFDDVEARFKPFGGIDAAIKKATLYDKANALATKPPAPKPKTPAGPNAPSAGQGQRPSSSEAKLKALNAKRNWSADDHVEFMRLSNTRK